MVEIGLIERIEKRIYFIRGQKVMLDRDLAELYGVLTKRLNEQVSRNRERFPEDFMFQLTQAELENWKSQFATSNREKMGLRKTPYAFTELGVAMLSSVLSSAKAIQMNIQIMRAFIRFHALQDLHGFVLNQLNQHGVKLLQHDLKLEDLFQALDEMRQIPESPKKQKIGFKPQE